ncbi:MAG: peptide-methionine (S)-S-oxide reductase MsrA [Gammaproteobacteria bacterium]|nr:peptide-methionine (S)-S-oxide reductase MsrA [Gammaproteobacteria bacterium]
MSIVAGFSCHLPGCCPDVSWRWPPASRARRRNTSCDLRRRLLLVRGGGLRRGRGRSPPTTSGYVGGHVADPSYEQVTAGGTGHAEAVEVRFDPQRVDYRTLLEVFWHNVDPTDPGGQFCDRGDSYRSGIFPLDAEQERLARASRQALKADPQAPSPSSRRSPGQSSSCRRRRCHQDYHRKNPWRYRFYKSRCGRTDRLEELWGER